MRGGPKTKTISAPPAHSPSTSVRGTLFESNLGSVVIAKFVLPTTCAAGAVGLLMASHTLWAFLTVSPILLGATFMFSIAIVKASKDEIKYKRLIKWRTIDSQEVVKSGTLWPPFIGYILLRRFVPPWGRIYFALDTNRQVNPFRPGEYPLLRLLQVPTQVPTERDQQKQATFPRLLIASGAGALLCVLGYFFPGAKPSLPDHPPHGFLATVVYSLIRDLPAVFGSALLNLVLLAGLILALVRRRHEKDGWVFAFLAGAWTIWMLRILTR